MDWTRSGGESKGGRLPIQGGSCQCASRFRRCFFSRLSSSLSGISVGASLFKPGIEQGKDSRNDQRSPPLNPATRLPRPQRQISRCQSGRQQPEKSEYGALLPDRRSWSCGCSGGTGKARLFLRQSVFLQHGRLREAEKRGFPFPVCPRRKRNKKKKI